MRTQAERQFLQLVEYGVENPSPLSSITERLIPVLNILDSSSEVVKFTMECYKNVRPVQTKALLSSLIASGALNDDFLLTKSCFGSFLSKLLFKTVTDSALECTKYCTQHWIDRIINEVPNTKTMPNPLLYLTSNTPTHPTSINWSVLFQFKLLDNKERKLSILDFRKLANLIPPIFYPRMAVAFFIFIEFYKSESQVHSVSQEVSLWLETWYNMLKSSLACSDHNVNLNTQPLHHLLCALMLSTKTDDFMASFPDILANILNGLEILCENSSGLTEKWISTLISEFQSKSVHSKLF